MSWNLVPTQQAFVTGVDGRATEAAVEKGLYSSRGMGKRLLMPRAELRCLSLSLN